MRAERKLPNTVLTYMSGRRCFYAGVTRECIEPELSRGKVQAYWLTCWMTAPRPPPHTRASKVSAASPHAWPPRASCLKIR
jgi:hypothetical protein